MGGKSSSSSSTSTTTIQTDERIAATDSAFVNTGSDVVLSDYGAINAAGELGLETIHTLGQVALSSLWQSQNAIDSLKQSADNSFNFVDQQNRDEDSRTITELAPWLMLGVSVLAISGAFKFR